MLNIGLTGGIGSGKSTVDTLFRERGAYIIDFDTLAHAAEAPNSVAWKGIVDTFGREILKSDNTIDRKKLGNIVFRDNEKLNTLNSIVHPAVFNEWKRTIERIRREKPDAIIISDIPLLIEAGWQEFVDCVILVYISPEEQLKRIIKRNDYSRPEAEERLNSQMPIDEKIAYADFIINNEGPVGEIKRVVDEIWDKLLLLEKKKRI